MMRIKDWSHAFKPTKSKMILTLLPFLLTMAHLVAWFDIEYDIIPVDSDFIRSSIFILLVVETMISQPLASLFESLPGFWSGGGLIPFPDGPLLPGSFAGAIVYALLIYFVWSLVAGWRKQYAAGVTYGEGGPF
jgi:hypothetical protein